MDHVPHRWSQLYVRPISGQFFVWQLACQWATDAGEKWRSANTLLEALSRPINASVLDEIRWQLSLAGWPVASRPIDGLWNGTLLTPDPVRRTVVLATIALMDSAIPVRGKEILRAGLV